MAIKQHWTIVTGTARGTLWDHQDVPTIVDQSHYDQAAGHLLNLFDGFTKTSGQGAWRSPAGDTVVEPVTLYHVFANAGAQDALVVSAKMIGHFFHQDQVCLITPDGEVIFLYTGPGDAIDETIVQEAYTPEKQTDQWDSVPYGV